MLWSVKFEKEENYEEKGLSKVVLSRPISNAFFILINIISKFIIAFETRLQSSVEHTIGLIEASRK